MKDPGRPTSKSTYWEWMQDFTDRNTYYLVSHKVWTKPMFTFHLLRHMAIRLDRAANAIRSIIRKYEKEEVEWKNN